MIDEIIAVHSEITKLMKLRVPNFIDINNPENVNRWRHLDLYDPEKTEIGHCAYGTEYALCYNGNLIMSVEIAADGQMFVGSYFGYLNDSVIIPLADPQALERVTDIFCEGLRVLESRRKEWQGKRRPLWTTLPQ